jgi:hypothetical protein
VRGRRASDVLALSVRMHGIELGTPVDALLDQRADRVIGFEVLCGDYARRFLPFAVAEVCEDHIAIDSALMLIDECDLEFYRRHARSLRGCGYDDPWIDEDGAVREALNPA